MLPCLCHAEGGSRAQHPCPCGDWSLAVVGILEEGCQEQDLNGNGPGVPPETSAE